MRELPTLPPPKPQPWRWSVIIGWTAVIGLVVAFAMIPSWRHNAVAVWDAGRGLIRKLFGL